MSDETDKSDEEEQQQIRANLTWNLFNNGQYKTPEGEVLDPDSFHGKGEILGVAYECWKEVCNANPVYNQSGCTIPWDSSSGHSDCSAYVSWVLYEYGIASGNDALANEFRGGQHSSLTIQTVDWNQLGFETIEVAAGQNVIDILQPGDILARNSGGSGHVNIIVEVKDGKVYAYDCGSENNWRNNPGNAVEKTYFASDSRPGMIIRKK